MARERCKFDVSLLCPWSKKQREAGNCICCILRDISSSITGKGMFPHPLTKEFLLDYFDRLNKALEDFNKPMQNKLCQDGENAEA